MKRRQDEDMLRQQDLIEKQKEQARCVIFKVIFCILTVKHILDDEVRISRTLDQRVAV